MLATDLPTAMHRRTSSAVSKSIDLRGNRVAESGRTSRQGSGQLAQGPWSSHKPKRPRRWVALGVVLLLAWCVKTRISSRPSRTQTTPCDPFEQPGRLLVDLSALYTQWRPLDEASCPPLPTYLPLLRDWMLPGAPAPSRHRLGRNAEQLKVVAAEPLPRPDGTSGSTAPLDPSQFLEKIRKPPPTILILGDSTDDTALDHFCEIFQHRTSTFLPEAVHATGLDDEPPRDGRLPTTLKGCELPHADGLGTALRVLSARLRRPYLSSLPLDALEGNGGTAGVDVVFVHTGLPERVLNDSAATSHQALELRGLELRRSLQSVRTQFPNARLVVRMSHRPGDEYLSPSFNRALHQVRHVQRAVAQSEGLPVFDFGRVIEGYQSLEEDGCLALNPAGVVYAQALVHQLRLALESPSSWRRGWLWDS
ncbi:hypothetical protein DMC30DRAFT_397836 [Rhodotorula diobovata]|uniref:Uncharacterized protein n=1 Tax=Rhodotorula diobovata TaxID=5288 RepID=A0A5C5FVL8_9BASI|nr:hypothetical protein DMC30DRAFT_397836 [Rhodotorula diobovata]